MSRLGGSRPATAVTLCAAAAWVAVLLADCGGERTGPPNVILILADGQGSTDLGCYGAADLHTPALDGLAARGVRFTQFYAAAPVCTASRASLLTGRQFVRALDQEGMRAEEVTLAELLRAAGYRTACFGKWNLGTGPQQSPQAQGFDEFFGFAEEAMDNYSHYYYWGGLHRHVLQRNGEPYHEDGAFFPDLVTREAMRFLDDHRDRPFFLYLPYNIPHYPLQPEARFVKQYEGIRDEGRRLYAAFLTSMDERVGQVLGRLDQLGLRDDTIVVFLSDHGHSTDERAFGGGGQGSTLRGAEGTVHEGGLRVPFLISAPGRIPEGQVRTQPATSMDLLPTIAAYTGVALPDRVLDGASLVEVIASATALPPVTTLHWAYETLWVAREGNWKAVGDIAANTLELYDLGSDPSESQSVPSSHPEVVNGLIARHNEWVQALLTDANVRRQYAAARARPADH